MQHDRFHSNEYSFVNIYFECANEETDFEKVRSRYQFENTNGLMIIDLDTCRAQRPTKNTTAISKKSRVNINLKTHTTPV